MAGRAWILTGTVALVLVAGCSSPDPVCESLEGLQGSIAALGDVALEQGALTSLQEAVTEVQSDVATVRETADEELSDEVGTLESTVQELSSSVSTLVEAPDATTIAALTAEIADTQQAWEALKAAAPDCELE
jgi:predicted lipoprotein